MPACPFACPPICLQVWVYEEADARGPANLYVHHTLMLPAFPLAVEWLDCDPSGKVGGVRRWGRAGDRRVAGRRGEGVERWQGWRLCGRSSWPRCTASTPGSFSVPTAPPPPRVPSLLQRERANIAAIASFEPGIELWDMDVVDAVEPLATLGGADYAAARALAAAAAAAAEGGDGEAGGTKKKGSKKGKKAAALPSVPVKPGSHSEAVLGLSWNRTVRNVLASASGERWGGMGVAGRGSY